MSPQGHPTLSGFWVCSFSGWNVLFLSSVSFGCIDPGFILVYCGPWTRGSWVWCLHPWAELRLPAKPDHALLCFTGHRLLAVFIFRHISFPGWEADEDLVALGRDANRWSLYRQGIEFLPSAGENGKVRAGENISTWTILSNTLWRTLNRENLTSATSVVLDREAQLFVDCG